MLYLYYGAADATCCLATASLDKVLKDVLYKKGQTPQLIRYQKNPILEPDPAHSWEAKAVFNTAAFDIRGVVHLVYRAMSKDNTSVMGYATSRDGYTIDERAPDPIYTPSAAFEQKQVPGGNSGCEDPRITRVGDRLVMCYTAFDGKDPPRVALTSISLRDFLSRRWNWATPVLISPPGIDDKDAAVFPQKVKGKYAILHRIKDSIWIDFVDSLAFNGKAWIGGTVLMSPRVGIHDSRKIGIASPPIETDAGWLLLYHGISRARDRHYHLRAALLDRKNPEKVLARTQGTIFEPELPYEREGQTPWVVFSCGAVIRKDHLILYYGGADKVIGAAYIKIKALLANLVSESG